MMRYIIRAISICLSVACMATDPVKAQSNSTKQEPDTVIPIPAKLFTQTASYALTLIYKPFACDSDSIKTFKDSLYIYGQKGHGGDNFDKLKTSFFKDNPNAEEHGIAINRPSESHADRLCIFIPLNKEWQNDTLNIRLAYEHPTNKTDPDHKNQYIVCFKKQKTQNAEQLNDNTNEQDENTKEGAKRGYDFAQFKEKVWELLPTWIPIILMLCVVYMLWKLNRRISLSPKTTVTPLSDSQNSCGTAPPNRDSNLHNDNKHELKKIQEQIGLVINTVQGIQGATQELKTNVASMNADLKGFVHKPVSSPSNKEVAIASQTEIDTTNVELVDNRLVLTESPQYDCFRIYSRDSKYFFSLNQKWQHDITQIYVNMKEAIVIENPFEEKYSGAFVVTDGYLSPLNSSVFRIERKMVLKLK